MKTFTRRETIGLLGAAAGAFVVRPAYAALPKLAKKDTYKVGFAQTESNNPWRLAQTKSMQWAAPRVAAYQARTWLAQGYTDRAGQWRQTARLRPPLHH